jgi:replicative DNA helicase
MGAAMQMKTAPHSVEAEQAILGALLMDPTAWDRIASLVGEGDFFSLDHRLIFRAFLGLIEGGKAVDVVVLAESLDRTGSLDSVGGLPYLVQLQSSSTGAGNIVRYAEIVSERALKRRLIATLTEVTDKVYSVGTMAARELLEFAQARMMAIADSAVQRTGGLQHVGTVMAETIAHIDDLMTRKQVSDVTGLSTGFAKLDKMTTGLQPGQLVILAARPAMGKTTLAMNIAEHAATHGGARVAFFSLEMINKQLGMRMLSRATQVHQQRVRVGRVSQAEFERLHDTSVRLRETKIYLDDEGSISVQEIRARCRRLARELGGLDLVVIDYLQLIEIVNGSDNRANDLAAVSRALKTLAKELHAPVIALSQLNRGLENRPNKRPIMSDLRESGGIEQDADVILFVYRDEVYHEDSPDKGIAEIIIGKQRDGPTGTVHVGFRGEFVRFEDRHPDAQVPSMVERANRPQRGKTGSPRGARESSYVDM